VLCNRELKHLTVLCNRELKHLTVLCNRELKHMTVQTNAKKVRKATRLVTRVTHVQCVLPLARRLRPRAQRIGRLGRLQQNLLHRW
jgi:hypothetical protein